MARLVAIQTSTNAQEHNGRRGIARGLGKRLIGVLAVVALVACASPSQPAPRENGSAAPQVSGAGQAPGRKAIAMAISREPESLEPSLQAQNREWAALASGFLSYFDAKSRQPTPYLAEELPSIDTGSWTVFPDGRMQTTYRLKKHATWQDGQPITAHDWVFAFNVRTAPDFPGHSTSVEQRLRSVVALDDHTLALDWREGYLWAGAIHLPDFPPMARHKLARLHETDRAAFIDGPHWREQFLGSGPFRVVSWQPGVEVAFEAYPGFVMGKPGIDDVRVLFIGDANTIVANLLSGAIDASFSPFIGLSQAQALEQAGWGGRIEYWSGLPRLLEFQGRDWGNTQRAVFDSRVRQAAHYAIDRQGIVDSIFAGRAVVAYHWIQPIDPTFVGVHKAVPGFPYDPRRAEALLREAGWLKGSDGLARSQDGSALSIPMLNHPAEQSQLDAAVVVDNWRAVGISSEIHRLSQHEIRDNELRSKFPGVQYSIRGLDLANMVWTADNLAVPEKRWSGQNRSGYVNPKLDDLWARVLASVRLEERERWMIEAAKVMTADAMVVLTHVMPDVMAYTSELQGVTEPMVTYTSRLWNVWEWRRP